LLKFFDFINRNITMEIKNTTDLMDWKVFKETLIQHAELILQFSYATNTWVNASYHITEIKQAPITSVDCGGMLNTWTEIIIQLWEPSGKSDGKAMKVDKALHIIELVEKNMLVNPSATVKIEFGNTHFDTRQMYPGEFIIDGENLIVNLTPYFTQCKAINRGDTCGPVEQKTSCCTPGAGCC
jgi:hypothetical protein